MKPSFCPMLHTQFPLREVALLFAIGLLLLFCGCAGVRPEPTYRSPKRSHPGQDLRSPSLEPVQGARKKMALILRDYMGAPYVWGGVSPHGVDCSGLVVAAYAGTFGLELPHSAAELFRTGKPVSRAALRFGDLVFFDVKGGSPPEHVGLYVGKGKFIHASPNQGVVLTDLREQYYRHRWAGARRLVDF